MGFQYKGAMFVTFTKRQKTASWSPAVASSDNQGQYSWRDEVKTQKKIGASKVLRSERTGTRFRKLSKTFTTAKPQRQTNKEKLSSRRFLPGFYFVPPRLTAPGWFSISKQTTISSLKKFGVWHCVGKSRISRGWRMSLIPTQIHAASKFGIKLSPNPLLFSSKSS